MPRFILTGDLHLTDRTPSTRIGDIFEDQKLLLAEIASHATEDSWLLMPGDLGHRRDWSPTVLSWFIDYLGTHFPGRAVCTLGQHDLQDHNVKGYREESDVGVLEAAGVLTVLVGGQTLVVPGKTPVTIQGYAWGDVTATKNQLTVPKGTITLVHAPVALHKEQGRLPLNSLKVKGAGVLLFGDTHAGFDRVDYDGVACLCPGVLTALNSAEAYVRSRIYIYDSDKHTLLERALKAVTPEFLSNAKPSVQAVTSGYENLLRDAAGQTVSDDPKAFIATVVTRAKEALERDAAEDPHVYNHVTSHDFELLDAAAEHLLKRYLEN